MEVLKSINAVTMWERFRIHSGAPTIAAVSLSKLFSTEASSEFKAATMSKLSSDVLREGVQGEHRSQRMTQQQHTRDMNQGA